MPKWIKVLIGIIISGIVLIAVGILLFHYLLLKSLPEYSGEKDLAGLSGKVEIYRDNYGVPYVFAQSDNDAAFSLGYLHAQERLFQMDIARRAGEGRLSEIFGSTTVLYDKMFKTFGMDRVALLILKQLDTKTRDILNSYSDGVNAYINEYKGKYPFEFNILQYDPYPWKPEHSLLIAKMISWELNISWWGELSFSHLIQKLGEEKVKEILPDYPENAPTIIPPEFKKYPEISDLFIDVNKSFRKFLNFEGTHIGSNSWVVNAKKSISGKPIIANDPHLGFQAPAKWYAVVIRGKTWKADGLTLPGVPSIVIGKNQNISWVLTNVMADDADFYVEHLDSTETKYLVDGNWNNLKISDYIIRVKDSSDIKFTVKETHRGPIISGVHPLEKFFPVKEKAPAVLSMRWTGREISNELQSFYSINNCKNWSEFKGILKNFCSPGQNFIYADKEGNIGYICGAKIPIRPVVNPTFVYDGSSGSSDWKGFVPYEEMPYLYNPPENYIASANNKTVRDFPYYISNLWEPPSRIERITTLLNSKPVHSVNDFMKYQMDLKSPYAQEITQYVLSAFESIKVKDKNLKIAIDLLSKWDYQMYEQSQVPAIYNVFLYYLMKNIFEDEMGTNLFKQYVFLANVPYRTIVKLLKENSSSWFDNIKTPNIETRDEIIRLSLSDALTFLEKNFGSSPVNWQWGNLHKVTHKHFMHGALSIFDKFLDVGPLRAGGDGTTLFNGEYSFTEPFEDKLGPSMRYIYDFSKSDEFYLILPTGQSGNILSDHYQDMSDLWLRGDYVKINTNENHIRNSGYKLLILK
jgi:penicillin G amidase